MLTKVCSPERDASSSKRPSGFQHMAQKIPEPIPKRRVTYSPSDPSRQTPVTNSLKILASLGCLLAGCDNTSVDPIQLAPRSTGLGGATDASGGTTSTKSIGPATGGVSLPKGGSGTGGASSSSSTGGSSSTTSGTGGATYSSCLILPTPDTGWVDGTKNECKIQGAWFSYNDCKT